ncbi:hypothetical protein WA158_005201 [Blastocystis sp. Blastoise]
MEFEKKSKLVHHGSVAERSPLEDFALSPADVRLRSLSMTYCTTPMIFSSTTSAVTPEVDHSERTPRFSISDEPFSVLSPSASVEELTRSRLNSRRTSELEMSDSERKRKISFNENVEPAEEPALSISFKDDFCNSEEFKQNKADAHLTQAKIKERLVRDKSSFSKKRCIVTSSATFLPGITMTHCRTGRIKRGVQLVKRFGIWAVDHTKKEIALKVMDKSSVQQSYTWDEDDVYKELRIMKELSFGKGHENVLHLFDAIGIYITTIIETSQYVIAIMELVDGDLQQYQPTFKNEIMVQELFKQIIQGYTYIVQCGYYHGDISLENILIKLIPNYKNTGKIKYIPKLSDFGRAVPIQTNGKTIIDVDSVAGKPYYLAPEAYICSYEAGPADIWSLGICLYILLYGYSPFDIANESDASFVTFCNQGFNSIIRSQLEISPDAYTLLKSMLKLNPQERCSLEDITNCDWLIDD